MIEFGTPVATQRFSETNSSRRLGQTEHLVLAFLLIVITATAGCGVTSQAANSTTSIRSISPKTIAAGGSSFTLVVSGTGFSAASKVSFNGQVRETTFINDTQVKALILASDIRKPGKMKLSVGPGSEFAFVSNPPTATLIVQGTATPGASTLDITTSALPAGALGVNYSAILAAANGVPPYTWGIASGHLPPGLNLQPSTGHISGTPSQSGTFSFSVEVTDSSSQSASVDFSTNISPASSPVITSVSPNGGPTSGGTTVIIIGSDFQSGASVSFGGITASSTSVGSSTQIQAIAPAHSAGKADVTVRNPNGASSTLIGGFSYNAPTLQITTASLPAGAVSVSYGAALAAANGAPPYTWGIASGQLPPGLNLQASSGQISGTPSQSGTFSFTVQAKDSSGTTATANFGVNIAAPSTPVVSSISPSSGPISGGTSVTITGSNFQAGASVSFGGITASSASVGSSTQIQAIAPAHSAGKADVTVRNPNGASSTLSGGFSYNAPTLQITTASLPAGAVSVSYGAALAAANGAPPYTWGIASGQLPPGLSLQASSGQISGTPSQSGAFSFTVQAKDSSGNTATAGFSVNIAAPSTPVVSSISPSSGPTSGGTTVTISGANFASGATVTFGGTVAASVTVSSSSQIVAVTPSHLAGSAGVIVQVSGQSSSSSVNFLYNVLTPTVTSVVPNSGPTAGGTTVTITGTNFLAGALVLFGTAPATNVTVVSATQIQATTPANAAGPANVTVQDPGNVSGSSSGGFTYTSSSSGPPTITGVSPSSGPPGTQVTITGTNFTSGATVAFGSTNSPSTVFISSTELTASVPTLAAGTYSLTATDPDPASATLNNAFTVTALPPAQSLLSGCTVDSSNVPSCATPSGWTLVTAQGFDDGAIPGTQGILGTVGTAKPHSGANSLGGLVSTDQSSVAWALQQGNIGSFNSVYLSYYEWLDSNATVNDEMFVANISVSGNGLLQEDVIDRLAQSFNTLTPQFDVEVQSSCVTPLPSYCAGATGISHSYYGNSPNIGAGSWHQWEIEWTPNTSGSSNGSVQVYRDGTLIEGLTGVNINGTVSMANAKIQAGGVYSKLLWTNNGQVPPGGTCVSLGGGQGFAYLGGGQSFAAIGAMCGPPVPSFNRYIDDVIVIKK